MQLRQHPCSRSGQTLMLFVFVMLAIFLFVGLAVDLGFAYITHAQLSKAVDAACLAGVRNYTPGKTFADDVAKATFYTNYGTSGRDRTAPTPQVTWDTDPSDSTRITVSATAVVNTYFLRVLPQWKTLPIHAQAQAIRARVLLMLVLDRSGSMGDACPPPSVSTGGAKALPGAVEAFVSHFDDDHDNVGMCSFGTTATLDAPVGHPFQGKVIGAARAMQFPCVWTYADGGLKIALSELRRSPLFTDDNIQKIVVFFTDGYANTSLNTPTNAPSWLPTPVLISQYDPIGSLTNGPWAVEYSDPNTGAYLYKDESEDCPASFRSINGATKSICKMNQNVWTEGQLVATNTANAIRQANITIYSIGLGSLIQTNFLHELSNDPLSPHYNPNQPNGEVLIAPTPDDMQPVFEAIARKVVLRLTQ